MESKKIIGATITILGIITLAVGLAWLSSDRAPKNTNTSNNSASSERLERGNPNAKVTLKEFADFECPACSAYQAVLDTLHEEYKDVVHFSFAHFPLRQIHKNAYAAALASEAAAKQGKFWAYHDSLYQNQREWSKVADPGPLFEKYAKELGLNTEAFLTDMQGGAARVAVDNDLREADALNLSGTPSFFLNGEKIQPPQSLEAFRALIEQALDETDGREVPPPNADLSLMPEVHQHADFALYLNGRKFDFSNEKYQSDPVDDHEESEERHEHDPYVHLHNKNGDIIHKHRDGVTLGYFFESLDFSLDDNCLKIDSGDSFCTDSTKSLKVFVNGKRIAKPAGYEIEDLDRILVSYGDLLDSNLEPQLASVEDNACIYSEKCPERGAPPDEPCVGGLGTTCEN